MFKDPFIISSIILAITFLFILIINQKIKSRVINISFLILSLVYLILIIIFDNNYIYDLLKLFITYFWYPNYLVFVTTILISIIILIYTILKKKLSFKRKIINYSLFCITFPCYITFLRLDLDPSLYSDLYQMNSLIILRIVVLSFLIWLILTIIFKLIDRGIYEK